MNGVPEELAIAVRRAATTVPPPAGDMERVLHRHRVRRRRRRVTAAATATTATLAAVAVAVLTVPSGAEPAPQPRVAAPSATPAQRLLLNGAGFTVKAGKGQEVYKGQEAGTDAVPGVDEVLLNGSVISHPVPGLDGWYQVAGLPDGRLVVLGYRTPMPNPPPAVRGNGARMGLPMKLEVLRPDDTIEIARDLNNAVLLGATEREAYLLLRESVVAHNLATGRERTVLPKAGVVWRHYAGRLDVGGGRVAGLTEGLRYPCWLEVTELTTGGRAALKVPGCKLPGTVRLSPNGRLAAVSYHAGSASRVAIVDITARAVKADYHLDDDGEQLVVRPTVAGMAWTDDTTLRVATMDVPENLTRMYRVDEILRVETFTVGG